MADDDSLAEEVPWAQLAVVGGGLFLAHRFVFSNPTADRCKNLERQTAGTLERLLDNPGGFDDSEYRAIATEHKNLVRALNDDVPADQRVNIADEEAELQGETAEVRAVRWVTLAHQQAMACIQNHTGKLPEYIRDAFPDWLTNYVHIVVAATTTAAAIVIIKKLIDFGRGGGGTLDLLSDYFRLVKEGIFGDPNVADDIEQQPAPTEAPQPTPTGGIIASLRALGEELGLPLATVAKLVTILDVAGDALIEFGSRAVQVVFDTTNLTADDDLAVIAAMAAALAAAFLLASADLFLPVGDAAGIVLVASIATLLGVEVNVDEIIPAGETVWNNTQV